MRTTVKPDFSVPGNDALSGKLNQLTHEFPLVYIFYHQGDAKDSAHIVIIAKKSRDVEIIESRKWIRNSWDENTVLFHITCQKKMDVDYRAGNPFIAWYCQKSAIIYQNPNGKECHDTDWLIFEKRFKKYSEAYCHDRNGLLIAVNRFQELDSLTGVFVSYLTVFEYDIRHLEILYTGNSFELGSLHQRIKQLTRYSGHGGNICPEKWE